VDSLPEEERGGCAIPTREKPLRPFHLVGVGWGGLGGVGGLGWGGGGRDTEGTKRITRR